MDTVPEFYLKDEPIQSDIDDILGRGPFVEALARALMRPHGDSSLAIGLYGKWGEGKTSVLNLLRKTLKTADPGGYLTFVEFDVWRYAGSSQLLIEFFNSIVRALDKDNALLSRVRGWGRRVSRIDLDAIKLSELIALYGASIYAAAHPAAAAAASAPSGTLPGAMIVGFGIVWHIAQRYSKDLKDNPISTDVLKAKIDERLRREKKRLVIIVDDIDRLTEPEIREVFRGVRELLDFANTTHLLAFDQDVVVTALNDSQKGRGLQYLQKIVQVDCHLPSVDQIQLDIALRKHLSDIFSAISPLQDTDRLDRTLDALRPFVQSMRDVIRLSNAVKFASAVAGLEVDPLDLVVFAALEIYAPDFAQLIAARGELFTDSGLTLDSDKEVLQSELDTELKRVSDNMSNGALASAARAATLYLFPPAAERLGKIAKYDAGLALRTLRISSHLRLPAYLHLSNPPGSIPQGIFRTILTQSTTREVAVSHLGRLSLEDLVRFVMQLERHIDQLPATNAAPMFFALISVGDGLVDKLFPMRGYGFAFDLRNVLLFLMRIDWSGCSSVMIEYVRNGSKSQFTAIDLANALEDLALHPRRATGLGLPEVQLTFVNDLTPSIVTGLATMAANHRLFGEGSHYLSGRRGTTAIAMWKSWDSKSLEAYLPDALAYPEDAKRFMRQLVTDGNDRQTSSDIAFFAGVFGQERAVALVESLEPHGDEAIKKVKRLLLEGDAEESV